MVLSLGFDRVVPHNFQSLFPQVSVYDTVVEDDRNRPDAAWKIDTGLILSGLE